MSGHILPVAVRRLIARRVARPVPARRGVARAACLYKVDRIGDFVVALGALHCLVRHFRPEQCRLVVSDLVAPLARLEFPSVPLWTIPAAAAGVWREMRPLRRKVGPDWSGESFEHLVCLRHARNLYGDLTLSWIHARHWCGLGVRPQPATLTLANRPQLTAEYPDAAGWPWSRELLAHRHVVAAAVGAPPGWAELRPRFQHLVASSDGPVAFCPFGSEPNRDYPMAAWVEAWAGVAAAVDRITIIGTAARRHDIDALATRMRTRVGRTVETQVELAPEMFLRQLAAARAIVTVESAAAHIAAALDKPAVVVMGGGHFGWLGPWGDSTKQQWLSRELPCFGCRWECQFPTVRCLEEISPAEITVALQTMMTA